MEAETHDLPAPFGPNPAPFLDIKNLHIDIYGGLYAFDTNNEPYTFKDINGDWEFGSKLILLQSLIKVGFH